MKERITYYDRARGILILLVVIGHVFIKANPEWSIRPLALACSWIGSFHMPAFFIISGMLFDTDRWRGRTWGAFLLKRLKTLVVPYLFFETVGILYKRFVLRSVTIPEGLLRMITLQCNIGADWFLPAMFFAGILMFVYAKYAADKKPLRIAAAVFGAACLFASWAIPGGTAGDTAIRALLGFEFMLTGHFLKRFFESSSLLRTIAAFVLTVGMALLAYRFAHNDFYDAVVSIPPLFWASGVAGTYFVLGVSKLINWKWLAWLGENSLTIMGTHQLVIYSFKTCANVLQASLLLLTTAAVEALLIIALNRFCPFLIGKPSKKHVRTAE